MKKSYCITSTESADNFVGIRFNNGVPEVVFPHGFTISDNEKEQRKDIFRLLAVLKRFTDHRDGDLIEDFVDTVSSLPLSSYQYIIQDFLNHGYYIEKETKYIPAQKGKINWKRTIQQEQPQIDDGNVVYLQYRIKTSQINDNNLLTIIHQYCVYKSFLQFGWLYLPYVYLPKKPDYPLNEKLFLSTLKQAINNTFNDSKRKLFQSMINILVDNEEDVDINHMSIGINKFEVVWERLVDYVFGEPNKEIYFPHAKWHILRNDRFEQSSALEPDTIMKYKDKLFVLDAKYYQFGLTAKVSDLPQTSSIQKQITYGKHIAENISGINQNQVYNAFIMPFNSDDGGTFKFVSVGTADWEKYFTDTPNYAYVLGILLDTKHIITEYSKHNEVEIERLSDLIEKSLDDYRKLTNQSDSFNV